VSTSVRLKRKWPPTEAASGIAFFWPTAAELGQPGRLTIERQRNEHDGRPPAGNLRCRLDRVCGRRLSGDADSEQVALTEPLDGSGRPCVTWHRFAISLSLHVPQGRRDFRILRARQEPHGNPRLDRWLAGFNPYRSVRSCPGVAPGRRQAPLPPVPGPHAGGVRRRLLAADRQKTGPLS
jgi:hypothetical protein